MHCIEAVLSHVQVKGVGAPVARDARAQSCCYRRGWWTDPDERVT